MGFLLQVPQRSPEWRRNARQKDEYEQATGSTASPEVNWEIGTVPRSTAGSITCFTAPFEMSNVANELQQ
jgi:hypothetical protein